MPTVMEAARSEHDATGGQEPLVRIPGGWYASVSTRAVAHARAAERVRRWGRGLGVVAVMFSTITGTTLFATLENSPSHTTRLVIAGLAAAAAVIAAVNTFFAFGRQEADHHKAQAAYDALKHELDPLRESDGMATQSMLDDFRKRMDALNAEEPTLPPGAWMRANKFVAEELAQNSR